MLLNLGAAQTRQVRASPTGRPTRKGPAHPTGYYWVAVGDAVGAVEDSARCFLFFSSSLYWSSPSCAS